MARFLVDAMLGPLARWLRILGFDALYADSTEPDDALVRRAREERRILVTRDRALAAASGGLLVAPDAALDDQLEASLRAAGAVPREEALFTRCSLCNAPLADAAPEDLRGAVPAGALVEGRRFRACSACGQAYWRGAHWARIEARFETLKRRLA